MLTRRSLIAASPVMIAAPALAEPPTLDTLLDRCVVGAGVIGLYHEIYPDDRGGAEIRWTASTGPHDEYASTAYEAVHKLWVYLGTP